MDIGRGSIPIAIAVDRTDVKFAVVNVQKAIAIEIAMVRGSCLDVRSRKMIKAAEVVVTVSLDVIDTQCGNGAQVLLQRDHRQVRQIFGGLKKPAIG
jgi:hypothetical protein